MAKNTGTGGRTGVIKDRKQTYNPKTGQFVKRDTTTGRILSSKDTPFKNVRKDDNAKAKHDEKNQDIPTKKKGQSSNKKEKKSTKP